MIKVKIYGAGSIGNHYAYACQRKKWDITIVDNDPKALIRMKKKIFPTRYGFWDNKIKLKTSDIDDYFDIVIIGTPPSSHLELAIRNLKKNNKPKILQIEKPLCTPDLKNLKEFEYLRKRYYKNVQIFGGYNHLLTKHTKISEKILKKENFKNLLYVKSYNNENWSEIFKAHFWLKSPKDSYLGFFNKGGGALCEHSHGLAAWVHYCDFFNKGKINSFNAEMKIVKENSLYYDQISNLQIRTSKNLIGSVEQDTITLPAQKKIRLQFSNGYLENYVNYKKNYDAILFKCGEKTKKILIKKIRSDDFKGLVEHLEQALKKRINYKKSPINIDKSIYIMKLINFAFKSYKKKLAVNYINV